MSKSLTTLFLLFLLGSNTWAGSYDQSQKQPNDQEVIQSENKKIIEDCEKPDRERPTAELKSRMSLLCGKAISLPKPAFPEEAKAAKASGVVVVEIVIDEKGRVIWAKPVEGHELLQSASVKAACRARYSPMKVSDRFVKATGVISYDFVRQ